ncbi:MAG: restriction endonuclease subunit S [Prochlorotrichaceae cyanobacterium]
MESIPDGWNHTKLGDVFDIARGGSPRPIQDFLTEDKDSIPWIMISDASSGSKYIETTRKYIIKEGLAKSRMVYPGDFLLTNSMSFGHPYVMKTSGCIHDGWLVLSPKNQNIDQDYFYHLLGSKTIYNEFCRRASGTTVKNLNIGLVKDISIPLPPIAEQKRIAAILDKADGIRRKQQEAIRLTEELLRSTFLEMFGDPVTNPKGWRVKRLEEFCTIQSGIAKGRKIDNSQAISVPYLRVANVQDGYLDLSEIKELDVLAADIKRYSLEYGDVLLTEGGDPDKLGRGAVWYGQIESCIHQNHIFAVRPNSSIAEPEYLSAIIGSSYGKRYFLKAAKQTTGIATINKTQLRNFPVLLPPVNLQKKYSSFINSYNQSKNRIENTCGQTQKLFNALLQRAFKGEI